MKLANLNMLFLEDQEDLAVTIIPLFKVFVQKVFYAKNIIEATKLLENEKIDLIFSDVALKNECGLDFVKIVKQKYPNMPIVILSALKDEATLLKAIPLGLTTYLLKPINYESLIDAFNQCQNKIDIYQKRTIHIYDDFYYDLENKCLKKDNEIYKLTKNESLFFELIVNSPNKILTKEMIASFVYNDNVMTDSALHNLISRLKKRLGKHFLLTISDIGYRVNS